MKFPSMKSNAKMFFAYFAIAIAAVITLASVPAFAQKTDANPAATLEQCRNGGTIATATPCDEGGGGSGWVTGNTGASNSHWKETDYLPYRMTFLNMSANNTTVHTVTIGYDVLKSGVHAIDYLGTYDLTETVAMGNNPCDGVTNTSCASYPAGYSSILIPVDPEIQNFPLPRATMPATGEFRMWGGTLQTIAYETYAGGEERRITLTFTTSVENPVLSWAGHVAWQGEWGPGNSAGGITGSPYHMRLIDLDGQGGNQDRSLSADAVVIPARITIIKDADPITGTTSNVEFDFTADPEFGPTAFTLIDNGILGDDRQQSDLISLIGTTNAVLVTEAFTIGWSLDQVSCLGASTAPTINLGARTANITVQEGENVVCTFTNGQLTPSAAPADVSGRVSTSFGRGISGAMVTIFNTSTGDSFTRMTNTFGYYQFNDLPVSDFYVMTVSHKRYLFLEPSRSFTLEEDMFDVDFIASDDF